jgi:hypothetical protein
MVQFSVDETTKKMALIWSYTPEPTLYTPHFGDVCRLPSGNTLVTFSGAGQVDELAPNGTVVQRINMALGGAMGYLIYMESLYEVR